MIMRQSQIDGLVETDQGCNLSDCGSFREQEQRRRGTKI